MKIFFTNCSVFVLIALLSCNAPAPQEKDNPPSKEKEAPLNIIFMIGDGMGLSQVSSAFYFGQTTPNFERFKSLGLIKTSCTSHKVTDSAAGATAFATGKKSYKRAISVSPDTVVMPTIVEELEKKGYNTGLISLTSITHATPAAFYAHVKDRDMHEDIAAFMPNSGVDFFAGGGLKYFKHHTDGKDVYKQLQESGYQMDSVQLSDTVQENTKYGFLLAEEGIPSKIQGRKDFLPEASQLALDYFSGSDKPFFLMIEGSYIDWGGHAKDPDLMVQEILDFHKTIGVVLDFVEHHENTLVVVTADHETGEAAIGKYYTEDKKQDKKWKFRIV